MTPYLVFETIVIAAVVAASLNHLVHRYLPAAHLALRNGIATRLGFSAITAPVASGGCGSGCGSCATGCATPAPVSATPAATLAPREQPLSFHPRKP